MSEGQKPEEVGKSQVLGLSKENCNHQDGYYMEKEQCNFVYIVFTYCPWCGTKLREV